MEQQKRRDGGFVLILVIWTLLLLSVLATVFAVSMRTNTQATANMIENARAAAYADAGVAIVVAALLDRKVAGSEWQKKLPVDGAPFSCTMGDDATLTISIQDEAGKVDINFGDERLIAALFEAAGVTASEVSSYVDRLVDFRDRDNLRRPGGAEDAEYRAAGLKHGPKNSEFASIDEVEQVVGFPAELIKKLRPYITVHSRMPGIDVEVAPLAIMQALFSHPTPNMIEATDTMASQHAQRRAAAARIPTELRVRSGGTLFSVSSTAIMNSGGRFAREAVVELTNKQGQVYRLKTWQRGDTLTEASGKQLSEC